MARTLFSPYGPRPKRSAQLVAIWMACFTFILFVTWYLTTRHGESTKAYAKEFLKPSRPQRLQ
jgi:hypothetical protein